MEKQNMLSCRQDAMTLTKAINWLRWLVFQFYVLSRRWNFPTNMQT